MKTALDRYRVKIRAQLRSLQYRGNERSCSCCGRNFKRFRPIGDPPRPDAQCPYCLSRERHRLLALFLRERPELLGGRVLHFAPERAVVELLSPKSKEYVTTNINDSADVQADITTLPFPDGRWDLIICSHVLEHVTDDNSAIRELRRVTAPNGHTIVIVPRVVGGPTYEDPTVTDPAERLRLFGQDDHVRIYGDDLENRLKAGGFHNIEPILLSGFTTEQIERYRLKPLNKDPNAEDAAFLCS